MKIFIRGASLAAAIGLTLALTTGAMCQNDPVAEQIEALKEQIRVLQERVDELEKAVDSTTASEPTEGFEQAPDAQEEGAPPPPPDEAVPESEQPPGAGRSLLLPEISLIGQFSAHASGDSRDADRNHAFLDYAELGIQSYVYPGIKADAFIAMPREADHKAAVEEAYLTLLKLGPGLSARVGKTKTNFGRTNLLHKHSYLYTTQARVLANLVAPESLSGQGVNLSYLVPTRGNVFAQIDAGYWGSPERPEGLGDAADDVLSGPGAAFRDRFGTARLWLSTAPNRDSEAELGLSHAWGTSEIEDPAGGTPLVPANDVKLSGADLSYRLFQGNNKRLLLRGEYYRHKSNAPLVGGTANGYYLLADQRLSQYREYALRYDWSEYPFQPGLHESGLSAIFTNQLTEQTYLRLQLTRGSRPGESNYTEAWVQWVWGVGPHTHELE